MYVLQICEANRSEGGGSIVILADMEKDEMDDLIEDAIDEEMLFGTKVDETCSSPIRVRQYVVMGGGMGNGKWETGKCKRAGRFGGCRHIKS